MTQHPPEKHTNSPATEPAAYTVSWRLVALQFLVLMGCTALGFVALGKMGAEVSWESMTRHLTPLAVAAPAGLYAFAWVVEGVRNWFLFRALGSRVASSQVVLGFIGGLFMAHITPFTAGGAPLQMAYFALLGVSTGESGAVFAIGGVFAQLTLALGVVVFLWLSGETGLILAPALYLLAMVGILVLVFWKGGKLEKNRVLTGSKNKLAAHMVESLRDIPPAMGSLLRIPVPVTLLVLLMTWMYHLIYMASAPLLFTLMHGGDPHWMEFTARAGVVLLLVSLSPTPGGAGAAEALSAKFLGPMLDGKMSVGDFTLLWRTVTFHWATLAGFVAFLVMLHYARKHLGAAGPLKAKSG